jgi:membrane protein DedA with SNARE-associated domain
VVTAQRRQLVVLLAPIAVLFAASVVGVALTPTLAPRHPLALLVLDARNRTLVLVAKHIDLVPFLVVAVVRRLSSDPLYYVLGRRYGKRAVRWVERQFGGRIIRATEALFRRASYPMVFVFPGALVCALAGQSGMHPVAFGALNVGGTVVMVATLRAFGTTVLADPVDAVLRFFNDHRVETTVASVALVVLWLILQKLTGHSEVPSISELEAELTSEEEPESGSEVEERVEADGHPGPGGDRLHREDDAG